MSESEHRRDDLTLGGVDRRAFMGFFSATSLAGTLFPGVLWAQFRGQGDREPTITAAMITEAEKIAGLEFTEEEREDMRRGLDRNVRAYRQLHELEIPNEVPPALLFEPVMPGVEVDTDREEIPIRVSRQSPPAVTDNKDDLAFLPLTQLAELVRTRQVSSVELTTMYLDRLKRYDPKLLFVVSLTEELALQQARRADQEIARGNYRGPLHGIPWGAKDLLAARGYKTSWGAAPYKDQVIEQDATVVRRLDDAGAVLAAKLTLGALAQGDRWYGGRTRNPWNTRQGSSGSSAGPGSATAAGCVGFSLGTETRGSITSPSTRNGVSGMRPSYGRVSRAGAMTLSWSMDKIGPMCRSVEDCALVFAAIHGADGVDPSARSLPFAWDPYRDPRSLRIGYLESAFEPAERYTNRDFDLAALRVLERELDIDLVPIELPDFPVGAMSFVLSAEAAAAFEELTLSGRDDLMEDSSWPNTFRTARLIPAVEYINANRARTIYMRHFSEAMRDIDVFVTPTSRGGVVGATNLTGHPQVVVPNGFSEEGTPYSISFVGGLYKDAEALLVAHAYQQATDFHLRHRMSMRNRCPSNNRVLPLQLGRGGHHPASCVFPRGCSSGAPLRQRGCRKLQYLRGSILMNLHSNAKTSPYIREQMVRRVLEQAEPAKETAEIFGVSVRTVHKWLRRYREHGIEGLQDRSSRPRRCPRRTARSTLRRIEKLRRHRLTAWEISQRLCVPASTVARCLRRKGLGRLKALEPKVPVRRYERERPGELLHIDTKQLAKIVKPGHRVHGDGASTGRVGRTLMLPSMITAVLPTPRCCTTRVSTPARTSSSEP